MSRILITGDRGFVGSRLFQRLLNDGHSVEGLDLARGDNLLTCALPEGFDVIYHLAAYKSVEESWNLPGKYLVNLRATVRLALNYPKAKIIHASSCASDYPGTSPYAFFKKAASEYLAYFHQNAVDLIFPNIYGGQQKQNSVVDIYKNKDTLRVDDPKVVRDYVHVDDVVDGLVKALEWEPGTYSMGSEIGTSTLELAEATGKPYELGEPRSGGKEPASSIIKNTTPNWKHTHNVLEYVKN